MMDSQDASFLYLNRDNQWRDFRWSGLTLRDDGALALAAPPAGSGGGWVKAGFAWGGPFGNPVDRPRQLHRLTAGVASLPEGAHVQFYIFGSDSASAPAGDPSSGDPPWSASSVDLAECLARPNGASGCRDTWIRAPVDAVEFVFPGAPLDYVWVGAEFSGEGFSSPAVSQMRIDFNHETYMPYLPGIYREDPLSRSFLARFLSLFGSVFDEVEGEIADLPVLFDPQAVPARLLPWLAGWLAVDLDAAWPEEKQRQAIAGAFEMDALRGTAEGFQRMIRFVMGVEVRIDQPLLHAAWWSLPADETEASEACNSVLGFTTMLGPSEPQGAVLGTTAVLDQSRLIEDDAFGAPLFEDSAYRFVVRIYRGQVRDENRLDALRTLIEREKPAHTACHLCIVEPRMRVGFQARVGVDTVVAGPEPPTKSGKPNRLGGGLRLGGDPPGRMGIDSRVGMSTRLGAAPVTNIR